MTEYEIFAWDGEHRYFFIASRGGDIGSIKELSERQDRPFPVVRQYDAAEDVLYGWDYLDSIIRMSGGGHFAENLKLYEGSKSADELLETATIQEPDELNKDIEIPETDA